MTGAEFQRDLTIALPDGTLVGYTVAGDPHGDPVLFFHGNPGSRLWVSVPTLRAAADDLGIRLIGIDLPGVGLSTYREDSVTEYLTVLRGVTDTLGLERYAVMGVSAGGKYACACAWAFPEQVTHVVVVSSPCSVDTPGVMESFATGDRLFSRVADRAPWLIRLLHATFGRDFRSGRWPRLFRAMAGRAPADEELFADPDFQQLGLVIDAEGYRQGGRGLARQDTLDARPWGVPLAEITVPVDIWHGLDDQFVPPEQGRILASAMPHVTTHFLPDEGHLSMVAGKHLGAALASAVPS